MSEWSITSKGMDPAGYEPRRLKGMALSYARERRAGACHLRATFYKPELGGLLEGLDDETYVQTYIDWEDRMLLLDSLTMCRFYRDLLSWDFLASAATQLNGAPVDQGANWRSCPPTRSPASAASTSPSGSPRPTTRSPSGSSASRPTRPPPSTGRSSSGG